MARLDYVGLDKKAFGKVLELQGHIKETVEEKLLHLILLRVSQINGCSYCVDMHWQDATKAGIEARVINGVSNWKYMPFFDDKTKAAFAWAEAVTKLVDQDVNDEVFAALKAHFTDTEMVALTHAITQMNALNRLAIAFAQHPKA